MRKVREAEDSEKQENANHWGKEVSFGRPATEVKGKRILKVRKRRNLGDGKKRGKKGAEFERALESLVHQGGTWFS